MSIDLKFVELTADVLRKLVIKYGVVIGESEINYFSYRKLAISLPIGKSNFLAVIQQAIVFCNILE